MSALNCKSPKTQPAVHVDRAPDKIIADRLDEQRRRIYQAEGSVQTVMKAINALDDEGTNRELAAVWSSLSLVQETLNDIAGQLEASVVLKQEVAHG
jgi:hypothetical protein